MAMQSKRLHPINRVDAALYCHYFLQELASRKACVVSPAQRATLYTATSAISEPRINSL
jgi:hypothetical protein